MKVKIPQSVLWLGNSSETTDHESRLIDIGLGLGEQEVDAESIFIGTHGPRYLPKPVYHVKPVSQSGGFGPYKDATHVYEPTWHSNVFGGQRGYQYPGVCVSLDGCSAPIARPTTVFDRWKGQVSGTFLGNYRGKSYTYTVIIKFDCRETSDGLSYTATRGTDDLANEVIGQLRGIHSTVPYWGRMRKDYAPDYGGKIMANWVLNPLSDAFFTLISSKLVAAWESYTPRRSGGSIAAATSAYKAELQKPVDLFHDRDRMAGDPVIGLSNYWVDYGRQHAFVDAINSVPRMNDNSISNVLEIGSFLYNLVVRKEVQIPHSLSDAWLQYRYQYNTTKLDIQEAIKFMRRHADVYLNGIGLKCYGQYEYEYDGTPVTVRCTVNVRNRQLELIDRAWRALDKFGLKPNFYIVWDSIPFSFIADWFLPIGDVLSVADVRQRVKEYYDFGNIIYSQSYYSLADRVRWKTYRRWVESSPPNLSGVYWLESGNVSPKQALYRALDSASLILG